VKTDSFLIIKTSKNIQNFEKMAYKLMQKIRIKTTQNFEKVILIIPYKTSKNGQNFEK
jgi:hypothetical protein